MNNVKNRLRNIEKAIAPHMVEMVSQFHCRIDGEELTMSALEFAHATVEEGHNGEILRKAKAPSIYKPANPRPDYTSLKAIQAEIAERMKNEPL